MVCEEVAEDDILVAKGLTQMDGIWKSPFHFSEYVFTNGVCSMAYESKLKVIFEPDHHYINEGLHSYYCFHFPLALGEYTNQFIKYPVYSNHNLAVMYKLAVIPKGSRYFVGSHFDIVSDKLVVYETRKDFLKRYNFCCDGWPVIKDGEWKLVYVKDVYIRNI